MGNITNDIFYIINAGCRQERCERCHGILRRRLQRLTTSTSTRCFSISWSFVTLQIHFKACFELYTGRLPALLFCSSDLTYVFKFGSAQLSSRSLVISSFKRLLLRANIAFQQYSCLCISQQSFLLLTIYHWFSLVCPRTLLPFIYFVLLVGYAMASKANKLMSQWHCRYRSLEELERQLTSEIASSQLVDDVKVSQKLKLLLIN